MIHTQSFKRKRVNSLTIFYRKICRIDTNVYQSCSPNDKHLSWSPSVWVKSFQCITVWSIIKGASDPHRPLWLALPKQSSFCSQRQQPASGLVTLAPPVSSWMILWQMCQSAFGLKLEGWLIFYHKFMVKNHNHCYCSSWIPRLRTSALFWKKYLCWSNTVSFFPSSLCASLSPCNKKSVVIFESKTWFFQLL